MLKNANNARPLSAAEVADFSASDHVFELPISALNCAEAGTLRVDTLSNTDVPLYVTAGLNPYAVTRIRNAGSDAIGVVGWV